MRNSAALTLRNFSKLETLLSMDLHIDTSELKAIIASLTSKKVNNKALLVNKQALPVTNLDLLKLISATDNCLQEPKLLGEVELLQGPQLKSQVKMQLMIIKSLIDFRTLVDDDKLFLDILYDSAQREGQKRDFPQLVAEYISLHGSVKEMKPLFMDVVISFTNEITEVGVPRRIEVEQKQSPVTSKKLLPITTLDIKVERVPQLVNPVISNLGLKLIANTGDIVGQCNKLLYATTPASLPNLFKVIVILKKLCSSQYLPQLKLLEEAYTLINEHQLYPAEGKLEAVDVALQGQESFPYVVLIRRIMLGLEKQIVLAERREYDHEVKIDINTISKEKEKEASGSQHIPKTCTLFKLERSGSVSKLSVSSSSDRLDSSMPSL